MNRDEDIRNFCLELNNLIGFGPISFRKLLDEFGGVEYLYENKEKIFRKYKSKIDIDLLKRALEDRSINYVCFLDDEYPENLRNIADAPIVLFYIGNWDKQAIDNSISIVGSRRYTSYGKKYTEIFSSSLAHLGFGIVSGMAFGIDRFAHISCVESKGYTIAVLASSVDTPTPMNNSDVYNKIIENSGVIISEYSPFDKISPGLFAQRNRIIAGISKGSIIIEAGKKSGSLITASLALDYGREVFAIPGSLDYPNSEGTNKLIRDSKAKLVTSVEDVLLEFGHNLEAGKGGVELKDLSFQEKEVYNTILAEPLLVEEISKKINKNIHEVISICSILEVKGVLRRDESSKFYLS